MRFVLLCVALTVGGSAAALAADPPSTLGQSVRKGSNAVQNASNVAAALQEAGYTEVRNTRCSGEICTAQAAWEDQPMRLRVELRTGRVEPIAGGAAATDGPPNKLLQNVNEGANAAQNAGNVTAALQQVGYSEVRNTRCSGEICTAQALWEDKPMKLRIEMRTRRIEATAE